MNVVIGLESDSVVSLFAARVVGGKYTSDNKKMVADSAKKAGKYQPDSMSADEPIFPKSTLN